MAEDIEIRKIEKPRIQELDLLKALAIIAMIICHCVEVLDPRPTQHQHCK